MISLIDTHQHLIYPDRMGYGWTEGIPALAGKAFTVSDYRALAGGAVAGSIFMETAVDEGGARDEARWVAGLASDPANGILGLIAACNPEEDDGFDEWLEEGSELSVVGYRRVLHVVDDEVSRAEGFRRNVRKIGLGGRVFDMCFLARQLPIAIELASSCDDMTLVLDHCGVPDIAGGGLDPWREAMRELAGLSHVVCKMSGLLAYCRPGEATEESIRPCVDHVFEVFGASRVVWGSDWPVVNLGTGLPDWLGVTGRILAGLSEAEANAVGHGNAERVYGVRVPLPGT